MFALLAPDIGSVSDFAVQPTHACDCSVSASGCSEGQGGGKRGKGWPKPPHEGPLAPWPPPPNPRTNRRAQDESATPANPAGIGRRARILTQSEYRVWK